MTERTQRRLAAIVAADVAGYSRLMRLDEEATMAAWWSYRKEVIDPIVSDHGGRVVKLTGDGFLAEFASATDAVSAAIAMQSEIGSRVASVSEDQRVQFRMGVNLGDILWDDEDIYGDGVNIAARIEALAEPGGILVSASIYDQVHHRLSASFEDLGEHELKNIDVPVRVYRAGETHRKSDVSASVREGNPPTSIMTEKPSIAVLPFDNMSNDPEQEYFADGITEDIITELSRFRSVLVIARNSSFAFKGKSTDVTEVGKKLNVQYVVEGSVRKAGNHVRITAQLIEVETNQHVWAERYDRSMEDIFQVQDDITLMVTSALVGQVETDRIRQIQKLDTNMLAAHDYVLRASHLLLKYTSSDLHTGLEYLTKAIKLSPGYADAHALLAQTHAWLHEGWWSDDPEKSLETAYRVAVHAVELDKNSGHAHAALAYACLYNRQHDQSIIGFQRALSLNPCHADFILNYGMCLVFADNMDEGLQVITESERLDPYRNIEFVPWIKGMAYFAMEEHQTALSSFQEIVNPNVEVHGWLAACHAVLGHADEAHASITNHVNQAKKEFLCFPGDTPAGWKNYWWHMIPFRKDEHYEHVLEGLSKAGLEI